MSNQQEDKNARVRAVRQQRRVDIRPYVKRLKPSKRYVLQPATRLLGSEIPCEMNSICWKVNIYSGLAVSKERSHFAPTQS